MKTKTSFDNVTELFSLGLLIIILVSANRTGFDIAFIMGESHKFALVREENFVSSLVGLHVVLHPSLIKYCHVCSFSFLILMI
jgi:hypothetical protein